MANDENVCIYTEEVASGTALFLADGYFSSIKDSLTLVNFNLFKD